MKNLYLKPFLITGLMLPSLAMAGGLSANSMALQNGLAKQSLANQNTLAKGVMVKPVSLQSIEDAVERVGGNANVAFGAKVGAVLIGSGADSKGDLAATSSASNGGPVVIEPPFIPENSISIVGAVADQSSQICAYPVAVDQQGNVIRSGSNVHNGICVRSEVPLRLKPGKYLLTYSYSYLLIDLKKDEHLVIPLRQVLVPHSNKQFSFEVFRQTCSPTEIIKTATVLFAFTSSFISRFDHERSLGDTINSLLAKADCGGENLLSYGSRDNLYNSEESRTSTNSYKFAAFPGVYKIKWSIDDGQSALTENITIE